MALLDTQRETATTAGRGAPDWSAFVADLTILCERYGVGIGGEPVCYVMEPDDYGFGYQIADNGSLQRL
jgi:hypothetical protein